jgi:hypothetical protein
MLIRILGNILHGSGIDSNEEMVGGIIVYFQSRTVDAIGYIYCCDW